MFATKVSSLIRNHTLFSVPLLRYWNIIENLDKIIFAIIILECWFKFNLVELLCQGESDSLIET